MTTQTISPYHRWVKVRLENDPEFREKYISRIVECHRKRYKNNPECKVIEDERSRKSHRERYANDPDYRERKKEQSRIYREKKKAIKLQQSIQ